MTETVYNMHDAKTQLSRLAERAAAGERITIARAGRPIAVLGPIDDARAQRRLGLLAGQLTIAEDFDDPLPEKIARAFEGDGA